MPLSGPYIPPFPPYIPSAVQSLPTNHNMNHWWGYHHPLAILQFQLIPQTQQTNRLQKCEANITQSRTPDITKKRTRWVPLNFCHLSKSDRKTLNPKHDVSLHVKGHKPTTVKSALTVQQASEGVGENLTWKNTFWDVMVICAFPTTSTWVGRCKHIKQCTGSESSESMDVSTCCWV